MTKEFLKPISFKFEYYENNKRVKQALKNKVLQEYKDSLKGINHQFDLDFLIDDSIGVGSTGAIFKGESKKNNKPFALKFIMENKSKLNSNVYHRRARNEIKLQYNLKNTFITPIYGYYTIKNDYCIVQELEKLGDLNNFQKLVLKDGFFTEKLLLLITNNILSALKHLKDLNIAHFDIKKDNILVDENFNFKLSDFSVAESYFGFKSFALRSVGTGCFISPENYKKINVKSEDLIKVDLWSLGVLLYKLINKENFPFNVTGKELSFDELFLKVFNNPLNLKDLDCSIEMKDLLEKLLKIDIKERISLEELINHPWIEKSFELLEIKKKYGDDTKFFIDIINEKL